MLITAQNIFINLNATKFNIWNITIEKFYYEKNDDNFNIEGMQTLRSSY